MARCVKCVASVWILSFAAVLLADRNHSLVVSNQSGKYSVLVLLRGDLNTPFANRIGATVIERMREKLGASVTVYTEFLEIPRFPEPNYEQHLGSWLGQKYGERKLDVIVSQSADGAQLIDPVRRRLWPEAPVVYWQYRAPAKEFLTDDRFTALITRASLTLPTLRDALRLFPGTKQIVVFGGGNPQDSDGQSLLSTMRQEAKVLGSNCRFVDFRNRTLEETREAMANLPKDAVGFFLPLAYLPTVTSLPTADFFSAVIPAAKRPVFAFMDLYIERGAIGGAALKPGEIGNELASVALRILQRKHDFSKHVSESSAWGLVYNSRELARWGISERAIPAGSELMFRKPSLWEEHRASILTATGLLQFESLLIAFLIWERRKRRKAQALLDDRLRFETLISEISGRFAGLPDSDVDSQVRESLSRTGDFLGVDQGNLRLFSSDGKSLEAIYRWTSDSAGFQSPDSLDLDSIPYTASEIREGRSVILSSAHANVAPEAETDVRTLTAIGGKSAAIVPLQAGGSVIGFMSFISTSRELEWPSEITQRLNLLGEFFANILNRQRSLKALREAEMEADKHLAQLAHMNRVASLGELASSIAHELNQPLMATVSNAQAVRNYLQSGNADLAEIDEILADIVRTDLQAGEVIQRMRELIHKGKVSTGAISLNEAIPAVLRIVNHDAQLRHINIVEQLDPDDTLVNADPVQIQQVILNLLVNAMQAIDQQQSPERSVIIKTVTKPDWVELKILDTGPGIPREMLPNLFAPFYTTKEKGLGLGLSICRSIIQTAGGSISAYNRDGGGAAFLVTLPVSTSI